MKKKTSFFGIDPIEELDMQHQGSVGGDQLASRISRNVEVAKASLNQLGQSDFTPGREPAEGADVAMKSPSHERTEQATPERSPVEGQAHGKEEKPQHHEKKHHYK
jgi:hypothetical protein